MTNNNTSTTTKKTGLKPIEVAAGAGAAVVTAFASSYLGTAGTLTGAALASVVGTVSTSVLRNSADRSAERFRQTTVRLRERTGTWPVDPSAPDPARDVDPYGTQLFGAPDLGTDPDRAVLSDGPIGTGSATDTDTGTSRTGTDTSRTGSTGTGSTAPAGGRSGFAGRPRWVALGAGAVVAFAVALVAITGIESAAGKPLAALVGRQTGGGTTIGRATGTDSGSTKSDPTPTPTTTTTGEPSATGSDQPAPTGTGSPTGGPGATGTTAPPAPTGEVPATTAPAPTQAPSATPNP